MRTANPYRPTTDSAYVPSAFAGRSAAYSQINQQLADPNTAQAAVFTGQRNIGKSALLWHFREFFPEQYVGVYIPMRRLQDTLMTEFDIIETLASYTRQALTDQNMTVSTIPQEPENEIGVTRGWFRDVFLPGVFDRLRRQGRLVLLLDDADILLERVREGNIQRDFFDFLGEVIATYPEIGLVMTIREESEGEADGMAPLTDLSRVQRLEEMTPDETALLMRIPDEYRITDEAVALVHRATGGQPLLSQRVGHALYERATSPDGALPLLDEADVREVTAWAVEASHEQFRDAWTALSLDERLVLTAISDLLYEQPLKPVQESQIQRWLVRADYTLDPTATRAALRGLEYQYMIRHEEDGMVIGAGLLQTWLIRNAALGEEAKTGETPGVRRNVVIGVVIAMLVLLLIAAANEGVVLSRPGTTGTPPPPTVTLDAP